jgi:3-oxoacyl-[acyl-carrier-protein] synthase II
MIGHAMGASGTLEAISTVLSIKNSIIPPTINYEYPDPDCDLDYTPNEARQRSVNAALSNSFGLGGQNACLVLKRYQE